MIIVTNVTISMVILVIVTAFWFWAEPSKILGPKCSCVSINFVLSPHKNLLFFPTNGLETLKGPVVPHLKLRSSDPRATGRTTWESVRLTEQTSATSPNHHLTTSKVPIVGRSQLLVSWLVGWFKVSLRPDSECASVCVSVWASNRRGRNCAVSDSSPNK